MDKMSIFWWTIPLRGWLQMDAPLSWTEWFSGMPVAAYITLLTSLLPLKIYTYFNLLRLYADDTALYHVSFLHCQFLRLYSPVFPGESTYLNDHGPPAPRVRPPLHLSVSSLFYPRFPIWTSNLFFPPPTLAVVPLMCCPVPPVPAQSRQDKG